MLSALVTAASVQELQGAPLVLARLRGGAAARRFARLERLWADAGYFSANLIAWCKHALGVALEIVQRPPGQKGFARCRAAGSSSARSPGSAATGG